MPGTRSFKCYCVASSKLHTGDTGTTNPRAIQLEEPNHRTQKGQKSHDELSFHNSWPFCALSFHSWDARSPGEGEAEGKGRRAVQQAPPWVSPGVTQLLHQEHHSKVWVGDPQTRESPDALVLTVLKGPWVAAWLRGLRRLPLACRRDRGFLRTGGGAARSPSRESVSGYTQHLGPGPTLGINVTINRDALR